MANSILFRLRSPVNCVVLFSLFINTLVLITLMSKTYTGDQDCSHAITRHETCDGCFPHKFTYMINNNLICQSNIQLRLVVLIFSHPDNEKRRKALRETWLTLTKQNKSPLVRHVFLLGKSTKSEINKKVENESKMHHDIIQENFMDTFDNLTYKSRMGMKWVKKNCQSAYMVMKTDDDMFVNIAAIIRKVIPRYSFKLRNSVGGLCFQNEKPDRYEDSKYYLSTETYPNSYFPPFCSGTGYITHYKVFSRVHEVASDIPYLKLEDVYLGLCLQYLGYSTINIPFFTNEYTTFDSCVFMFRNVMTSHLGDESIKALYNIWNATCNEKTNVSYIDSNVPI